jgi:hypothetical protein
MTLHRSGVRYPLPPTGQSAQKPSKNYRWRAEGVISLLTYCERQRPMAILARCMPNDVSDDGTAVVRGNRRRPPIRPGGMPKDGDQIFVWTIEEHGGTGLAERGVIRECRRNGRNFEIDFTIEDRQPSRALSKSVLQPLRAGSADDLAKTVADRILEYAPTCITHLTDEQAGWLNRNYYHDTSTLDPARHQQVEQERRRIWALIEQRTGQRSFREALIGRDGGRCAITRCEVLSVLEACHLIPFANGDPDRDNPNNGILLRADIHLLFDKGLAAIDPISHELWLADELAGTDYEVFRVPGRRIHTGAASRNLRCHFNWVQSINRNRAL